MTSINYTDPGFVVKVKVTPTPTNPYAAGYGPRTPTRYMILYLGHWRRVYVMQYANSGSAYIMVANDIYFLDTATEHRLEKLPHD